MSHSFLDLISGIRGVELKGERILLRPYRREDALPLYEAARESVKEVSAWLAWCHADYSMRESQDWIKSGEQSWKKGTAYEFAVFDHSGDFLGGCGLNQIDQIYGVANMGYWVRSSCTRQGVATEAARLVARFGFRELSLNRIEILAAVGNQASQRVAQKTGALREGVQRNRIVLGGNPVDAVMFSLIPQDFPGN